LNSHGIENAHFEAEVLLRHAVGLIRVDLFANLNREITSEQISTYSSLIQRRITREPTAYITGHKEFYELDFLVNPPVLIPRPETELLVESAISLVNSSCPQSCVIADIGTGCGAIAIALAVNLPAVRIYATDISNSALKTAEMNIKRHHVEDRISVIHGDLLDALPERVHIIVANLPYVRHMEIDELSPEIGKFEQNSALDGGVDGLRLIERLLMKAEKYLIPGGMLLLEIGYDQGDSVCEMAGKYLHVSNIHIMNDLNVLPRVVKILTTE
jgi:release factor glutamine methyltransferase